jgi:hypothetical protein
MNLAKKWLSLCVMSLLCLQALWSGQTKERRPRIFLEYSTRRTALDPSFTKMWIDGAEVDAKLLPGEISYRPKSDLSVGRHDVRVLLVDKNGEMKDKRWSFEVSPKAEPLVWKGSWVDPTPKNGEVLKLSEIKMEYDLQKPAMEDVETSFYHSVNGSGYRQLPQRAVVDLNRVHVIIDDLDDGAHSIEMKMIHRASGKMLQEQTSFVVDRNAPRLEGLVVRPQPYRAGQDIEMEVRIQDPPWNAVKDLRLWLEDDEGRKAEAKLSNVQGKVNLTIPGSQMKDWPEGVWRWQGLVKDHAGHKGGLIEPSYIQVLSGLGQKLGEDLELNPYPKLTSKQVVDFSGIFSNGHHLLLFVNDQEVATKKILKKFVSSSDFTFSGVELKPGLNTIGFEIYGSDGFREGERRYADPILVDTEAPRVLGLKPSDSANLTSPRPKLSFSLKDFAGGDEDTLGIGVQQERVMVSWESDSGDSGVLKLHKKGEFYKGEWTEDLAPGVIAVTVFAEDRFQNARTFKSQFSVAMGLPQVMKVEASREKIYDVPGEEVVIVVNLQDEYGRTVGDGTVVEFSCDRGILNQEMLSKSGFVSNRYFPGLGKGEREVTISVPSTGLKKTLNFKVLPPPEVMPYEIDVKVSRDSLVADGGRSRMEVSAELKDEYGQALRDGMEFSLKATLCEVSPAYVKSVRGRIRFSVKSTSEVGMGMVQIKHRHFVHRIEIPLSKPKPGPAQSLEVKLWPPVAKVGSSLPIRLTGKVVDAYGQTVPDGTLVTFKVDKGWVKPSSRTVDGSFLNNVMSPKKEGVMVLTVRAGRAEKKIEIPVRKSDGERSVEKIEVLSSSVLEEGDVMVLEGRLSDAAGVQVSQDTILWIKWKGRRIRRVARSGLFYHEIKDGLSLGQHSLSLESEAAQQAWSFEVKPKVNKSAKEELTPLSHAPGYLDMDFVLERKDGDLRSGLLVLRELDDAGLPIKREKASIADLQTNRGSLPPKTYLVNGVSRIPFSYELSLDPFFVEAQLQKGQPQRLDFLPERLPTLTFADEVTSEPSDPQVVNSASEVVEEVVSETSTVEVAPTSNASYTIDQGLDLVRLSGKLELEAGGRDRTRFRYRVLNNKGEALADGTEVELRFPQGKLRPDRVKVRRGVIRFQLESTDWVGSYPLEFRVGQVTKSVRVRIRAPRGGDQFLPGLPTAAGDRRKFRGRR